MKKTFNINIVNIHLNIITEYLNFIIKLNNKHINNHPYTLKHKEILNELIYHTDDDLFKRLMSAFNYIIQNYKNQDVDLLLYVKNQINNNKLNKKDILKLSLNKLRDISTIKEIFEIIIKSFNRTSTPLDRIYIRMIT